MTQAMHPSIFVTLGLTALIVWRVYARIRRSIGRQTFSPTRSWTVVGIFPLLAILLLATSPWPPLTIAGFVGSTLLGIGLALYGLRLTKFEATAEKLFYTPNAHIGIALSLVFVARVVYRLFQVAVPMASANTSAAELTRSPLTLIIFGALFGYYVTYAIGLLRWQRGIQRGV